MHDGPAAISPRAEPWQMVAVIQRRILIMHETSMRGSMRKRKPVEQPHRLAAAATPS
jgi:hypothetical protein